VDDWGPTASQDNLRLRARLLATIRSFFSARGVLEVETPLLSAATVSDPHLHSLPSHLRGSDAEAARELYLQTSPESAMKRLLAAGCGPIYQICKAFRGREAGRQHNPEFTILEWYRPGFDHHDLMDEMDDLLAATLGSEPAERITFRQAFERELGIDPHTVPASVLERRAAETGIGEVPGLDRDDRDGWLDLLLSHALEPHLGRERPTFVYDYPASQAALARVRLEQPPVAERFEVYVEGVELANGYHELVDAAEQRLRYEHDLELRRRMGLAQVPPDERLLAALESGLPRCAGVALGVDRLVMLAAASSSLADVLAFPIDRA
jgi:lysyl-tRNA synthetase class 2